LAKGKIAIVGGGMAALSAAFELTRTQALQDRFDVTIYQLGWRLGGKAASGRDSYGRIVEHGLHVWFGCYENAFGILCEAYEEWQPQAGQSITGIDQAFQVQAETIIGSGDLPQFVTMPWPHFSNGHAGVGDPDLDFWRCVEQLQNVIFLMFGDAAEVLRKTSRRQPRRRVTIFDSEFDTARTMLSQLVKNPAERTESELRGYVAFIRGIVQIVRASVDFQKEPLAPFRTQLLDVGTAIIKGLIFDVALGGKTIADLDQIEFRDWLCQNGADRSSAYESFLVKALYDSMLQYVGGDPRCPSYAAGVAAQVALRLYGSYRGDFVYELAAGMGEIVITPIYRVLRQRGVSFEFFHKLTAIGLNGAKDGVATLTFDRQVCLKSGTYEPTMPPSEASGYLEYWPNEPDWSQIDLSEALTCTDLESYWCQQKVGESTLMQGEHFDDVVLAIPVSAFMQLNDVDKGPCAELIEASASFRRMTETASPVPSISVQAWMTESTHDMGGISGAQLAAGPRPLDIWADRTVEMTYENWQAYGSEAPRSLQFLCDVLETDLFTEPAGTYGVMALSQKLALETATYWFENKAAILWPKVVSNGSFDWDLLFDPNECDGKDRLGFQVVKANVSPTDCCAGSPPGSTRWRLAADASGFDHLFLTGSWIDSGFNTECIETAVMSGRQAARAIRRDGFAIPGEWFPYFEPSLLTVLIEVAEETATLAEAAAALLFEANGSGPRHGVRARLGNGRGAR
jgi:uncharacterized protein with NAD-binding domain and iron-sulfur cluster